jgi:hypothetical protein
MAGGRLVWNLGLRGDGLKAVAGGLTRPSPTDAGERPAHRAFIESFSIPNSSAEKSKTPAGCRRYENLGASQVALEWRVYWFAGFFG